MQPSIWSVFRRRWQDTRLQKSAWKTASEILLDVWEFLRESTPDRRRSLYGDMEYDWDHNVNTTSGGVSHRTRFLATLAGGPYQPTEPTVFQDMLKSLDIDFGEFTFVDLGSGKGRTLLMAAEFGFRRIVGVELLSDLHTIAQSNIQKSDYKDRIESICVDARDYTFPLEPLVIYLFNPLPSAVLNRVIENVAASLALAPRPLRIIYHNPVAQDVLADARFLRKIGSAYEYAIYSN